MNSLLLQDEWLGEGRDKSSELNALATLVSVDSETKLSEKAPFSGQDLLT